MNIKSIFTAGVVAFAVLFGNFTSYAEGQLSASELNALEESLVRPYFGFFNSSYEHPTGINWNEVFYDGAGLGVSISEQQESAYRADTGSKAPIIAIPGVKMDEFIRRTTDTEPAEAKRPLLARYYADADLYIHDAGQFDYQTLELVSAELSAEGIYEIQYKNKVIGHREGRDFYDVKDFTMKVRKTEDSWKFISNLAADDEIQNVMHTSYHNILRIFHRSFNTTYLHPGRYIVTELLEKSGISGYFIPAFDEVSPEKNGLSNVGYSLRDINGDGIQELFIGLTNGKTDLSHWEILRIYTLEKHRIKLIYEKNGESYAYLYDDSTVRIDYRNSRISADRVFITLNKLDGLNQQFVVIESFDIENFDQELLQSGHLHRIFDFSGKLLKEEIIGEEEYAARTANDSRAGIAWEELMSLSFWTRD